MIGTELLKRNVNVEEIPLNTKPGMSFSCDNYSTDSVMTISHVRKINNNN